MSRVGKPVFLWTSQGHYVRTGGRSKTPATVPGIPTTVAASLSGTVGTETWLPPASDGGAAITAYTTTRVGGATHTKLSTDRSDTFTGSAAGDVLTVAATNSVGTGPVASVSIGGVVGGLKFPGYTNPLVSGKRLVGCSEADDNGLAVKANWEYKAPETDTGVRYGIIKSFYTGASVEDCFIPATGGIADDMIAHCAKGRMLLVNIAIQKSTSTHFSTWREAANISGDPVVYSTYYEFIRWVEDGAAWTGYKPTPTSALVTGPKSPDCPVAVCMPHEPQTKVNTANPSAGMLPSDYCDMQWAFRTVMDDFAKAKTGTSDPTDYKWKKLSFGGLHVGDVFNLASTNERDVNKYYVRSSGVAVPHRVHDWVGGDPYQQPISGGAVSGTRHGVPGFNSTMQAMCDWCKTRGYPITWGEYGVHNTDTDAGFQLEAWWNKIIDGTYDIWAAIYFHSAPDVSHSPLDPIGTGVGRWLFTDLVGNDAAYGGNGGPNGHAGLYTTWKTKIQTNATKTVHFWDLTKPDGTFYARPPGV